jgi:cell wall-associated NlpC family hydrolase
VPKHIPALATRAAVVATTTAAAAFIGLLPATTAAAAPAIPAPAAPASAPAAPVSLPVAPAALTTPAALTAPAAASSSAVKNAMSKIGAPYRWGATGPNAFDCSGLVSWAYKNAGISLPRTSRAMSTVGTKVAKSDLRPGDLVFFYKPVSHVGIYIGDGKIVHASSKKSPVKVSDMNRMPFNSARRV